MILKAVGLFGKRRMAAMKKWIKTMIPMLTLALVLLIPGMHAFAAVCGVYFLRKQEIGK